MSNIPQGCKPFNLQEALSGKPVVTRDGRAVKIAGYNPEAADKSLVVLGWAEGNIVSWCEDGLYIEDDENPVDLFMAPETKDVWVIVYEFQGTIMSVIAESENEAAQTHSKLGKGRPSFGIHKITITV